jgi:hypothetical protein
MATAYLPLFVEKLANIEEVYHFNMFAVREGDGRHVEVLVAEPARVDLANRGDVEALCAASTARSSPMTLLQGHSRKSG